MQVFGSRVLAPLAVAIYMGLPIVLVVAVASEIWRSVRARHDIAGQRSTRRDARALLVGATVGSAAAYAPANVWLEGRLGMLLVLPALGASVGLIASGLLPVRDQPAQRVAHLQPRRLWAYVSPGKRRFLAAACAATAVIAVVRLILPPERPTPPRVIEVLGGEPAFSPTRALYVAVAVIAFGMAAASLLAAKAIITRSRPAANGDALARQELDRRVAADKVVSWTAATLLLLNATLLTPFPRKMQGIVFGDVQLIQRTTDVLIVGLVVLAVVTVAVAHRRQPATTVP